MDDRSVDLGSRILSLVESAGKIPYLHNDMTRFEPGVTPIFYSGPYWGPEEVAVAIESLLQGHWLAAGDEVRKFETELSRWLGQKHGLMANSGSSANLLLVESVKRRMGWQSGDEVVVSVVGFPTTVAPLIQSGLKPVFVDIELESLNFDLDLVEKAITSRTKAVFLSPVLGNPPDMDRLLAICRKHGLELLLDECDSLGSTWCGKHLGSLALASSHSFYSSHHLCTGEGGMLISDDPRLMRIARSLAWWGRDCTCVGDANLKSGGACGKRFGKWLPDYDGVIDHRYVFSEIGYNFKPLDLQGAIGRKQLAKLPEIVAKRKAAKERIGRVFQEHLPVRVPSELPSASASWFGVPVVAPDRTTKQALVAHFEGRKVQTRHYFAGNILQQPGFAHLGDYRQFPHASLVLDRVFFVGCAPHYTEPVFLYLEKVAREFHPPGIRRKSSE